MFISKQTEWPPEGFPSSTIQAGSFTIYFFEGYMFGVVDTINCRASFAAEERAHVVLLHLVPGPAPLLRRQVGGSPGGGLPGGGDEVVWCGR